MVAHDSHGCVPAGKVVEHPLEWHASMDRRGGLEDMQVLERTANAIEEAGGGKKRKGFTFRP